MGVLRLALPVAVASLVDLCVLRAGRLDVASRRAAGAAPVRGPRRRLLGAVLLGATAAPGCSASVVEECLGKEVADSFNALDLDSDQRLTQIEFEAFFDGDGGSPAKLQHMTTFFEADVDGDDLLSLQEFAFSRFLAMADSTRRGMERARMGSGVPATFIQDLDDVFLDLRRRFPGGVRYEEVFRGLAEALGMAEDTPVPEEGREEKTRDLFAVADIIPDGLLNMNELDFFHFLVREDFFVRFSLPESEDDTRRLLAAVWTACDRNGDGQISHSEALDNLVGEFADTPSEHAFFRKRISRAHQMADSDGSGGIDPDEADRFLRIILRGK